MIQPEIVVDYECDLGENPLWHPGEQRLYWTDITRGRLYRYDPASGSHEQIYQGEPVGGFTFQADGGLLLFMHRGRIALWHDGQLTNVVAEIPGEADCRFNDVIADPGGRVFCGTMPLQSHARPGRLYRLDTDGSVHQVLDGIVTSNGMGFTPDRRGMYYTDTGPRRIYYFDYDEGSGALTNQRLWLQVPENAGGPDGMTVDAVGTIWSARWDGSAVYQFNSQGVEQQRIPFPAQKVTSVMFGGPELSDLYVTSALSGGNRAEQGSGAGALFRIPNAGRGLPEFYSRVKH